MNGKEKKMFTIVVDGARSIFVGTPEEAEAEARRLGREIGAKTYEVYEHRLMRVL